MRRLPVASANAGFTLVEALLAVVLMSIILAAIGTITAQWLPYWDKGVSRVQRTERLAAGLERLVADLAAAEIVTPGAADNRPLFQGTDRAVVFVRTAIGPNAATGLEVVRIAPSGSDDRMPLLRTTAPFAPGVGQGGAWPKFGQAVVLLAADYRVYFSYAGEDAVWRDSWRGEAGIPRAIRVRVRDAATLKDLAVSTSTTVRTQLPANCASDKKSGQCPATAARTSR